MHTHRRRRIYVYKEVFWPILFWWPSCWYSIQLWAQVQVQRKLFCGEYIESQYYNHLGGKKAKDSIKGVRLLMGNICEICYSFQDVLLYSEINRSRNIVVKNPLVICRDCFNSNIKITTSGGSSNAWENQGQRGTAKTSKLQVSGQISNKKARKQKKIK